MAQEAPERFRDTVYVVGAGFSAGLGYPLTKNLLIDVWSRLETEARSPIEEIIAFHHPGFDVRRKTTFPDIEQLLTEIAVNLDLFDASRAAEGNFRKADLENSRQELLSEIGKWFHGLYGEAAKTSWLGPFIDRLQRENAAIISFNWDLVLDQQLFERGLGPESYGFSETHGPVLLKPHGSLNWYEAEQMMNVSEGKHIEIFVHEDPRERFEAFLYPRAIISTVGKHYTPLIVPPTYLKDFSRPIFRQLWRCCTDVLSTPKELIFLGYSLPPVDLHSQYIFRCGFHNQIEGRLKNDGTRQRHARTGPAKVTIVNPDRDAALRIEAVAGTDIHCNWVPKKIEDWLEDGSQRHA